MTIEQIKKRKPNNKGIYWGNIFLNGKYKLVMIKIIDEGNEIVRLRTRGKQLKVTEGWVLSSDGSYFTECFAEEVLKVFDWNYN